MIGPLGHIIKMRLASLGSGRKVVFSVKATNAQRVRFTLTPTGTDVGRYARLLGEDRTPADVFTLVWRYPAEGLSAHLGIQAIGPGGTTDKAFGIAH